MTARHIAHVFPLATRRVSVITVALQWLQVTDMGWSWKKFVMTFPTFTVGADLLLCSIWEERDEAVKLPGPVW